MNYAQKSSREIKTGGCTGSPSQVNRRQEFHHFESMLGKGREEQTERMEGLQEIKRSPQIQDLISSEGIHGNTQ